ncbi:MAG: Ku protein, partial [Rhodanobacteraceae bacterium]
MARPIWTGTISFGLLQVPVRLMTAERRTDLHFHMLDSRDNSPIRYERVNSETGAEVPWKDVVKAFEYSKGNYVVIDKEDMQEAAPESLESVDIESFVDPVEIDARYYDKPYYLLPAKHGEKGYVLLRETLRKTGLAGVARVVIRTREHLALVIAEERTLLLMLLRFPQELIDEDAYELPAAGKGRLKISAREMQMAHKLVESMHEPWKPSNYRDDYRDKLSKVIERRLKSK